MSLDKTEKELYNPKSDIENRGHEKSVFDINEAININQEHVFEDTKETWQEKEKPFLDKDRKKALIVGVSILGTLLFIMGVIVGVMKFKQGAFSQDRVLISIEGNLEAKSVQDSSYFIKYKNDNRVALENVEIILNHSENFYPKQNAKIERHTDRSSKIVIGNINSGEKGEIEVVGNFYAAEDYTVYLQPVMTYKPVNISSEFRADSQIGVKIITSPIDLKIVAPKEALDESTAEYTITYKNKGTVPFEGLNLKLEYSEGFVFQGANPLPIEDKNIWHIGKLDAAEEKTIFVQGKIEGDQFDVKSIKGTVYKNERDQREVVFAKAEEVTKVVVPPLAINHKINNQSSLNINVGDSLDYEINYTNNGSIALRDIIIKLKIDSPLIDYGNLSLEGGAYESKAKTITWKATDVEKLRNLEPGANGFIKLTVPIKKRIEIGSDLDKNFILESIVTIDSSDVAYESLGASKNVSNKILAKLNSKVIIKQDVFFEDDTVKNFGPTPPKVGEETTYTVHWNVDNIFNDISEVKVKASLPTWMKWKGDISPTDENIGFNERTNEVVWDIGKLDNSVGVLSDSKKVIFQVGVVPEINQLGKEIVLISETVLTAKDDFTGSIIEEKLSRQVNKINNKIQRVVE